MQDRSAAARRTEQATCSVCGEPIRYLDRLDQETDFPVCGVRACKQVADQRTSLASPIFAHQLEARRRAIEKGRARKAAEERRVEAVRGREAREAERILDAASHAHPDLAARRAGLLSIPSASSTTVLLTAERRASYRRHLEESIQGAREGPEASDPFGEETRQIRERYEKVEQSLDANPDLRTVSDRVCALCRGSCCIEGGDRAYLTRATIRRVLADHPEWSPGDVLDAYLSRLAPETIEGACINQSATGCVLPRSLRADTCNSYYCDPLKDYQARSGDRAEIGVVLTIRRANPNWRRFDPASSNDVVDVTWVGTDLLVPVAGMPEPAG